MGQMTITFYELLYTGSSHYAKAIHVKQTKTPVCIRKCYKIFVGRKRGNTQKASHRIMRVPHESDRHAKVFLPSSPPPPPFFGGGGLSLERRVWS